ncbi:MAG: NAD+ synthase [Anaerolineae bacterium]|jgi:NAD+ synthase (glutamine-hydrolysing)
MTLTRHPRPLRLALAQINATVGDLQGNEQKILGGIERARDLGVDVVAFPELCLPGYPPEDLLLKPSFLAANRAGVQRLARAAHQITAIVGFVDHADDLYNAAAVLHGGEVTAVAHKSYLPTYAVFDEDRYFQSGQSPLLLSLGEVKLGINICEDIWHPGGPTWTQALAGAQLIINISASPYHVDKGAARERMLATRAADHVVYVAFCNLVGGQDELVFDGGSVIFDGQGDLVARGRQFVEDLMVADLDLPSVFRQRLHAPRLRKEQARWPASPTGPGAGPADGGAFPTAPGTGAATGRVRPVALAPHVQTARPPVTAPLHPRLNRQAEVYQALVLGTRDYAHKNGFRQAVIGISGGIDSALTAAIAAEALGPESVTGVFMPSRYSSEESREDASRLADNLGIQFLTVPIDDTFQAYLDMLADPFAGQEPDVTEENLQARIRGNILMALSNKFGSLVLTTGNKSEMSVGYATLYGDMAGGFAVIKDVPKMLVYELGTFVNAQAGCSVIPQRIFDKAPTAELRPDQKDEDSLPPYPVLDLILQAYVEQDRSLDEIVALGQGSGPGFDPRLASEILHMVDRAEYKRRQAPPGVRITQRALGKDRRLPITNHYREVPADPKGPPSSNHESQQFE